MHPSAGTHQSVLRCFPCYIPASLDQVGYNRPDPPAVSRSLPSFQMVHTHTHPLLRSGSIKWRMTMKMKGWPTHPNKRTTGKEPKTTKAGHQQQQGGGRRQEARGGGENSIKRHNKHNRERLSGDRVWNAFRVWWTTAHHTQTQEKEGDATRKRREQTHPRPWQQPGSALKGKEKAESEHPGRPTTEAATVGRGTNNPLKAWKRHQRPNTTKPSWGRNGPTWP